MSSANQHNQCHGPAADIVWPASGAARVAIEIDAKLAQPRDFGSCPRVGHAMPPPPHSNSVLGRVWLDHQRRPEVTPPPEQFGGQIVGSLRHPRPPDNSSTLPPRATRRTFPIDCGSAVGPPRHQMSAGGPDLRRHTARASFRSSSPRAAQTGSPANQEIRGSWVRLGTPQIVRLSIAVSYCRNHSCKASGKMFRKGPL